MYIHVTDDNVYAKVVFLDCDDHFLADLVTFMFKWVIFGLQKSINSIVLFIKSTSVTM